MLEDALLSARWKARLRRHLTADERATLDLSENMIRDPLGYAPEQLTDAINAKYDMISRAQERSGGAHA